MSVLQFSALLLGISAEVGLNGMLRGRGGGGGSAAAERKRVEKLEETLLLGIKELLVKVSGRVTEDPSKTPAPNDAALRESQLAAAVLRILTRSEKNPGTLLDRLKGLVGAAQGGHFGKPKQTQDKGKGKGAPLKKERSEQGQRKRQWPGSCGRFGCQGGWGKRAGGRWG